MDPGGVRLAAALALAAVCAGAAADDIPGPRWEINLDASGARNGNGWTLTTPSAEVFYQWSRRIQLTADTSWTVSRPYGERPAAGLGSGTAGFKWFLLDDHKNATSFALWPQLERGLTASSVRRGLASANRAFALPVEAKFGVRSIDYELTAGRTFIEAEPDQWNAALKVIHHCLPRADCVLEAERSFAPGLARQSLVMLGAEWKLSDALTLKTSAGRELGTPNGGQDKLALLVGLKIVY